MAMFKTDFDTLTFLNSEYLRSDQQGDTQRYDEMLADDFTATLPGPAFLNKKEFLHMMSQPRPFTELKCENVDIRILDDFALVHAQMSFRALDGTLHEGRYTDDWQKRDGEWKCVAANVVGPSFD